MPETDLIELVKKTQGELAGFIARGNEEFKTLGKMNEETATAVKVLIKRLDDIDAKAARPSGGSGPPSLLEELKANPDLQHLIQGPRRGAVRFTLSAKSSADLIEGKTLTRVGVGWPTHGVMPTEREPGISFAPRPQLRMRDVLSSRPTVLGDIYFVSESVRPTKASPQTESSGLKPLTDITFTTDHELVETMAITLRASRQILDDWSELEGFLRAELAQRVRQEEDMQILFGSGTSPALHGLTVQAQAWDISMLTASDGYEYIDIIGGFMQQIAEDDEEQGSPFVVLHPGDWWKIRRTKDSTGRYILGDPQSPVPPSLWQAPVVDTTCMTKGYCLVGSGSPVATEIRDRMSVTVEMSTEDGDNFRYNLVTVRAESRLALVTKRPNAFCYGALTQSPA